MRAPVVTGPSGFSFHLVNPMGTRMASYSDICRDGLPAKWLHIGVWEWEREWERLDVGV